MAIRTFVKHLSNQQLLDLKPGARLDLAGPWFLYVSERPPEGPAVEHRLFDGTVGRGDAENYAYAQNVLMGAQIEAGILAGGVSAPLPVHYDVKSLSFPDWQYGQRFPTEQELADECALRGI